MLLYCDDGIRLQGFLNQANATASKGLVILIHGWEGSAESTYMLSMATTLLRQGMDVFRLNLRDHGDTHHLNREFFNATLLAEVISGLENLQSRVRYSEYTLVGFSLGGNIAARVAAASQSRALHLSRMIGFCPVLHSADCNKQLSKPGNYLYDQYFVKKWKRSIRRKLEHFPEYDFAENLTQMRSMDQMNREFVPRITEFKDMESYFEAYKIAGKVMRDTICPCHLHWSRDDMIVTPGAIADLANNPGLYLTVTDKGGHCGYLSNWRFESWMDYRVLELLRYPDSQAEKIN